MLMVDAREYRRFRAPPEDGQTLVDPLRPTLGRLVAQNRAHLQPLDYDLQGRSLADLAAAGRRSLVERALEFTRRYRDVSDRHRDAALGDGPIVLSGHQPQLFHAGVWYKNFVLGDVARKVSGAAIHLLIDSDLCRTASIRVPSGSVYDPRLETVPLDDPAADVPFEQRSIQNAATFATFGARVSGLLQPLVDDPIIDTLWPLTPKNVGGEKNLGLSIAQGRHRLEALMSNDTLELPQSQVCNLFEFHWFVAHLLANLPRFHAAYNDALSEYRRAHRLRNRAHPVPDLGESDGWLEAPFWIWTDENPRRQGVFARQIGDALEITDRRGQMFSLTLSADRDADLAAEQLADAAARGVKIRTRALATTFFARLLLGDLFLHGIGGAKYDQVTDDIARRFLGFSLPEYATASATLRLPIERPAVDHGSLREIRRQLREITYHPERFLTANGPAIDSIVQLKRRWLATTQDAGNGRGRHEAITAANVALQPFVAPQRVALERKRIEAESRDDVDSILNSREYAFCLFPRDHFERLLDKSPSDL